MGIHKSSILGTISFLSCNSIARGLAKRVEKKCLVCCFAIVI
jgi:hypothetical protein